jgi:phosphopantothenoylcysteine decarboxylase/phosphopantothenate--cysteine ligase
VNVVLGVSGSVAAYRAADIARDLMRRGFVVRVCLTDAAQNFVTAGLFEALTGQPSLQDVFEEPVAGRMAHIDWARQADAIVVAPATANTINKLASGLGDDMLTTIALATAKPLVLAPAMNPQMLAHPATQAALATLKERGAFIVEPTEGDVACGEHGEGKLASNAAIVETVSTVVGRAQKLAGRSVLITSGPTQEPIDDVRFISNRSSGKMGASLARAALLMGANVTVVTGPTREPLPLQATIIRVSTAVEMRDAVMAVRGADLMVGAAAVADYKPESVVPGKIRRTEDAMDLHLVKNPDIIAEFAAASGVRTIGFAAEPGTDLQEAKAKIDRKGLFGIAANNISQSGIGFDSDQNELTLILRDGTQLSSGKLSKLQCALWLLEAIA